MGTVGTGATISFKLPGFRMFPRNEGQKGTLGTVGSTLCPLAREPKSQQSLFGHRPNHCTGRTYCPGSQCSRGSREFIERKEIVRTAAIFLLLGLWRRLAM
jgi:hypothetical protein